MMGSVVRAVGVALAARPGERMRRRRHESLAVEDLDAAKP
jgi:hypothetical protein